MATNSRPGQPRTPRGEFDRIDRDIEAVRRDKVKMPQPKPLVMLEPEPADHWPAGTAWLDTSAPTS